MQNAGSRLDQYRPGTKLKENLGSNRDVPPTVAKSEVKTIDLEKSSTIPPVPAVSGAKAIPLESNRPWGK
jgi:hypothetical protein